MNTHVPPAPTQLPTPFYLQKLIAYPMVLRCLPGAHSASRPTMGFHHLCNHTIFNKIMINTLEHTRSTSTYTTAYPILPAKIDCLPHGVAVPTRCPFRIPTNDGFPSFA